METLLQGMLREMGDGGIEKIAQSAGIDAGMAKTILEQAGPLLAGKMADNAKSPEGLESLDKALSSHDGSIFDRMDDVANPDVDTKGSSILGKIFGGSNKVEDLAGAMAKENKTDNGTIMKVLGMAAPLILGQLGGKKKSGGLDAAGIFDMLQSDKKASQGSGNSMLMGLATQFLDKDGDGDIKDDLLGMAMGKLFGGK
ncbi:MAG: DUF937 domain-containing protein [Candidatus Pacebacteria bacterium]|nr:DUF937 domain-containing protein [Candidatus Paceibacterota bacterium]